MMDTALFAVTAAAAIATVILAGVAVVIGFFAFFGYNTIKEEARKAAEKVARQVAEEQFATPSRSTRPEKPTGLETEEEKEETDS